VEKNKKSQLRRALLKGVLIRFASAPERGTINGYVLDVGPTAAQDSVVEGVPA